MYARIFAVAGVAVDVRTTEYKTERGLNSRIEKELSRARKPCFIERYISGKRISTEIR